MSIQACEYGAVIPNGTPEKWVFSVRGLKSSSHFPKGQPQLITDPVLLKNPLRATQASLPLRKSDQISSLLPCPENKICSRKNVFSESRRLFSPRMY
ncbi:hypothetical protein CDAR_530401 [Caerostris darwini]|uniref:Uncharacterized protein n=1 Tax=Caerostris darwini TaxID=1538125 RepID=A0AAV4NH83_9ARAC|nr:hypothetical protein CDAR_530401 [Caerostris darwini]